MEEKNLSQPGQQPADTLKDIREIMERSSRFISLSGISGIAAGVCALVGAWVVTKIDTSFMNLSTMSDRTWEGAESIMKLKAVTWLGVIVFIAALFFAFFFTWQRSKKSGVPIWSVTARRLMISVTIPMLVGGILIIRLIDLKLIALIAPACLIFYGLALLNGSKYTLVEIRYLGYCQIILGLINLWIPGYGLWFWTAGFGILHIVYGFIMWFKYERK